MRRVLLLLLLLAIGACVSGGPRPPTPTSYDFGLGASPLAVTTPVGGSLAVDDVAAAGWLAGDGIVYRLAYENAARPAVYGLSRWVAPPADLLSQRLVQRLANVAAGGVMRYASGLDAKYILRVELEEFSQVFDARDRSRAVVRLRASLLDSQGAFIAQETFDAERPAKPDAAGAVMGLRDAADELIARLATWLIGAIEALDAGGPRDLSRRAVPSRQ